MSVYFDTLQWLLNSICGGMLFISVLDIVIILNVFITNCSHSFIFILVIILSSLLSYYLCRISNSTSIISCNIV